MIEPTKEDIGRRVKFRRSDGKNENGVLRSFKGSASVVDFDQRRHDAICSNAVLTWAEPRKMQPVRSDSAPRPAEPVHGPELSAADIEG